MSNFRQKKEKKRKISGNFGNFPFFFLFLSKVRHLCNKLYHVFVMLMNLIGFDIENLSYNWSIITYRNSCTNSIWIFHCIKLANGNGNGIFQICANTLIITIIFIIKNRVFAKSHTCMKKVRNFFEKSTTFMKKVLLYERLFS